MFWPFLKTSFTDCSLKTFVLKFPVPPHSHCFSIVYAYINQAALLLDEHCELCHICAHVQVIKTVMTCSRAPNTPDQNIRICCLAVVKCLDLFPPQSTEVHHVGTIKECFSSSQVICWEGGVIVNAESEIQFRNKFPLYFPHAFPNPTDWCSQARPF